MFPSSTKILLVEDMESIRSWEKMQLEKLGLSEIFEAVNGKEALALLEGQRQKQNPIELILCDWRMPEMDGLGLFAALQKNPDFCQIPFMMITAESDTEMVMQAMEAGVIHYLTKPFSAQNLQEKLELMGKG